MQRSPKKTKLMLMREGLHAPQPQAPQPQMPQPPPPIAISSGQPALQRSSSVIKGEPCTLALHPRPPPYAIPCCPIFACCIPCAHDGTGALVLGVLDAHAVSLDSDLDVQRVQRERVQRVKDKRTPLNVGPLAELDEVLTTTSETERSEILCALLHILCDNAKKSDMADVCLSAGLLESIVNDDVRRVCLSAGLLESIVNDDVRSHGP